MPSKGNGHGRGLSPTSSLPVPDLSARRQDPSPLGSHWVWVHTPHLGPPEPQRQLSRAHISPCLPPDHTRSAQARAGGAGGLGRAGSWPLTWPDQQSPRQGGSQAPGRRGHRGLLEEARRTPLAPVPASPGACPLPGSSVLTQSAPPALCITTSDPCILVVEVPQQDGPQQPGGRVRGLQRGCRPEGLYGHGAWPWAARWTGGPGGSESPGQRKTVLLSRGGAEDADSGMTTRYLG